MSPEDRIARAQAKDAAIALANAAPVVEALQHAPIIETPPEPAFLANEEPPASPIEPGAPVVELIPEVKMNEQKIDAARESLHEDRIVASQTGEIIGQIDGVKLTTTLPESDEVVGNKVEQLVGEDGTTPALASATLLSSFVAHVLPESEMAKLYLAVRDALYNPALYDAVDDQPIPEPLKVSLKQIGVTAGYLEEHGWREALNDVEVSMRALGLAQDVIILYSPEDMRVTAMPTMFYAVDTPDGKRYSSMADLPKEDEGDDCDNAEEDTAVAKSATAPAPFFPADEAEAKPPAPPAPPMVRKAKPKAKGKK